MTNLQLEGQVDTRDQDLVDARNKIRDLENKLESALTDAQYARREASAAVSSVREILSPLYRSLRMLFGEMDTISPGSTDANSGTLNPRLEAAKKSLPGNPAKFIGLLETHGTMNVTQFTTYARCSKQTVYNTMSVLLRAGIVQNSGGKYSLKV